MKHNLSGCLCVSRASRSETLDKDDYLKNIAKKKVSLNNFVSPHILIVFHLVKIVLKSDLQAISLHNSTYFLDIFKEDILFLQIAMYLYIRSTVLQRTIRFSMRIHPCTSTSLPGEDSCEETCGLSSVLNFYSISMLVSSYTLPFYLDCI